MTAVSVDAVFEQFPASVRGAVVIRGRDIDPHHVVLQEADVVELRAPTRPARPLELGEVTVNVAPKRQVMIPFEVPFAGLEPGWYGVTAEVLVDGQELVRGPAEPVRRFVVSWPSGTVRRGRIEANVRIGVPGSDGAAVERVDCRMDSAVVHWRHAPSDEPGFREFGELKVTAGRRRLPAIDGTYQWGTGDRTTIVYPVLREDEELTFELDRRYRRSKRMQRGKWAAVLPLP